MEFIMNRNAIVKKSLESLIQSNLPVAGSALQISRGIGHPDAEIRGEAVSHKFISALRASVWSTNEGRGGAWAPGPLP